VELFHILVMMSFYGNENFNGEFIPCVLTDTLVDKS
jgi:hypothetical protein